MSVKGLAVLWSLIAVGVFRSAQICSLWMSGEPLAMLFAASEASVLLFTCGALVYGSVDGSWRGLLVPLLHVAPTLLRADADGFLWAGYALLSLCLVQIALRAYMGRCLTSGVPVFVELKSQGPYSIVRHPLALVEILIVLCFALRFQSYFNLAIAFCCLAASIAALLIEEAFLIRERSYRIYAACTPYRLIPRVW